MKSDEFATFTQVLDIPQQGADVVLDIQDRTYFHNIMPEYPDPEYRYWGEYGRRYYTFAHQGNRWILTDAKLDSGADPPFNEPSVAES